MKRISLAAAAAVGIASLAASPALADEGPRLPKGWIRGAAELTKMPAPPEREWGSFQSNHESSFRVRSSVPGGRVDLEMLPVIDIEPSAVSSDPPRALPEGSPGDVVVLKHGAKTRVSVAGFDAGWIRMGKGNAASTGRQSEGGLANICGSSAGAGGVRALEYEAIRRVDEKGSIELVFARGFFDASTCRASIIERRTARPRHIGGGVVYAFRARCAGCAVGERDVLHVLTPQMVDRFEKRIPFEHRTLALAPGKSAAFEGSSSFRGPGGGEHWSLPDWHGVIDRQCKDDSVWCIKSVRLEVSQGIGEASATVFVGGDVGM